MLCQRAIFHGLSRRLFSTRMYVVVVVELTAILGSVEINGWRENVELIEPKDSFKVYRRRYKYLYGTLPAPLFARFTGRSRSRRLQGEACLPPDLSRPRSRERIDACRFLGNTGNNDFQAGQRGKQRAGHRVPRFPQLKLPEALRKLSDSRRHAARPSDTRSPALLALIFHGSCSRNLHRLLAPSSFA